MTAREEGVDRLVEPFRTELLAYCYRTLGSRRRGLGPRVASLLIVNFGHCLPEIVAVVGPETATLQVETIAS